MTLGKYIAGGEKNTAYEAISKMMNGYDVGVSYADMMRLRISGGAAQECYDVYYVAHDKGRPLSRHWMGYGRHEGAVGNWGNFLTAPEERGKGYGGSLLKFWYDDFKNTENKPSCFLCIGGALSLAQLYSRFGFRPAIRGREFGPLYMPVGDSPDSFLEFTENYYKPSPVLFHRPATIGYRHEIDCLLRFYFVDSGLEFGIGGASYVEEGLLYYPERVGMLFTEVGRCVGWSLDGELQTHPLYKKSDIIDQRV